MENKIIITDIKMSFGSMIIFMVKWAIATIPAMIILWSCFALFVMIVKAFVFK